MSPAPEPSVLPVPDALRRSNPFRWLRFFGPGAIIASLTIGTGELIFSSRGGSIFGYRILWLFLVISILKWGLVYGVSRHMVLSGVHPFERWRHLPGPRAWFPLFLLLLSAPCFPIWVGFHSGVIGTLGSWLLNVDTHLCGAVVCAGVFALALTGGYQRLERVQLVVVGVMLVAVTISLLLLRPDWMAVLKGLFIPQPLRYPDWLAEVAPAIAARPVWVETVVYVSVIGGMSYDYLVYVSFLRDKRWGLAGYAPVSAEVVDGVAADPNHPARRWVLATLVDSVASFAAVVFFSLVFVSMGAHILGPARQIPDEHNMLDLQAKFVTQLHSALLPLYVIGAALTMIGTLYGTFEIATRLLQETMRAVDPDGLGRQKKRLRMAALLWCGIGGISVILWNYRHDTKDLIGFITPATLFTGVLSCGFVCFLAPWADRRFLPSNLRMNWALAALNIFSGLIFIGLGIKSYWDYGAQKGPWVMVTAIAGMVTASLLACGLARMYERRNRQRTGSV